MSGFPKILWNCDVSAGLTWAWNDGVARSVALTDATHDTVLELGAHLQARIRTIDAAATVTISPIGIVTVTIPSIVAMNWAGTSNALSTILGFDETEALSGTSVTSSAQHLRGYYPGLISYGYATDRGAGLTTPIVWIPDYHEVRSVAGSLATRSVGVVTPQQTLDVACSLIRADSTVDEWSDDDRGVRAWIDACTVLEPRFRLYPDRANGIVGTPGTVGTHYYNCAFAEPVRKHPFSNPRFVSWSVSLNRETVP